VKSILLLANKHVVQKVDHAIIYVTGFMHSRRAKMSNDVILFHQYTKKKLQILPQNMSSLFSTNFLFMFTQKLS